MLLRGINRPLRAGTNAIAGVLPFAAAPELLCVGCTPGFMAAFDGEEAGFDYLGDGRFRMEPPVPTRVPPAGSRHDPVTAVTRLPVFLELRECRVLGAALPVTIESGVPTSRSVSPYVGCCRQSP